MSGIVADELERSYRRLVAFYPRSFRRENGEEIVAVLLATARESQRRPGVAESADLLKGALRMRIGLSRTPRTVLHAVRLMYLGAIAQFGVLLTVVLTEGSIRAAVIHRNPGLTTAQLNSLSGVFTFDIIGCCVAAAVWVWMAWANGKGYSLARVVAIVFFGLATVGMIAGTTDGTELYAPAGVIADGVVWLIGLGAVVLLLHKQSGKYFARQEAR